MRWTVHSERPLYSDEWVDVRLADVEITGGRHLDHRIVRLADGAAALVVDDRRRVLLIWRHRFITDSWGWELPSGMVGPGEDPAVAAAREAEEETGWRPGTLRPLIRVQPQSGISDAVHHVFHADGAELVGPPADDWEADRIAWIPLTGVRDLIDDGQIVAATTVVALLYVLTSP